MEGEREHHSCVFTCKLKCCSSKTSLSLSLLFSADSVGRHEPKRFKWGWTENLFAFVKFQHTLDFFQLRNLKCARRKGSTHCVQMSQRHAGICTMSPGFSNLLCGFSSPADRFDLCTFSMWQIEILEGPRGSPPMPLSKLLSSNHYITISLSRFSASLALLLK